MQTITLQVQDSFIPNLLNFLHQFQDEVKVKKDKNLELDPFFYERQKQLEQDIKNIESGKIKMLSQEEYSKEIENFFIKIKAKYENQTL